MIRYKNPPFFWNLFFILLMGCITDNSYQLPDETSIPTPVIDGHIISIKAVLGMLAQQQSLQGETATLLFTDTNNYMEGYVISTDKSGNFFKKLVLQDKTIAPTAGIVISIDVNPLYTSYEIGRKILVRLDGLVIGIENGVPTLGQLSENKIDKISSFLKDEVLIRMNKKEEITPLEIPLEKFGQETLLRYVRISQLQFHEQEKGKTFAAEPYDVYNGERIIESCRTGLLAILSTSVYADFNGVSLPLQRGAIDGVISKDFYGERFNLIINDPTAMLFTEENRCDPEPFICDLVSDETEVLFRDDFNTYKKQEDLENAGYQLKNILGGATLFKSSRYGKEGTRGVNISGFKSGETPIISWLISPKIAIREIEKAQLLFDIAAGYDRGQLLEVFITHQYSGDPLTTAWKKLQNINIPIGPYAAYGAYQSSGVIPIGCIEGDIVIGFRYIGGDASGMTTTYRLDNLTITKSINK
ncbi:DUF5689 domain-containing protein [Aquimarina hainanensis]|uniref:DUF5689 domain-containing protein n=1 Tax=Aquimarina hainanensis TaxID=1578017 RepID=A0ABW5N247_9FLAO